VVEGAGGSALEDATRLEVDDAVDCALVRVTMVELTTVDQRQRSKSYEALLRSLPGGWLALPGPETDVVMEPFSM
jgi:hypothetical protein